MSDQDFVKNPFAALFPCPDDAEKFRTDYGSDQSASNSQKSMMDICPEKHPCEEMQCSFPDEAMVCSNRDDESHKLSHALEEVFRITLSKDRCCSDDGPVCAVYLKEVHAALHFQAYLDVSSIERALFERVLLDEPKQHVIYRRNFGDKENLDVACEKKKIFYLYQSYHRLTNSKAFKHEEITALKNIIVTQVATALITPEMFPGDQLYQDLIDLILEHQDDMGHSDVLAQFFVEFSAVVVSSGELGLADTLSHAFAYLQEKFVKSSIANRNLFSYVQALHYFTKSPDLTLALIRHSTPQDAKSGIAFQNSLLGLPLSISCLPRSEHEPFEFYQEPSKSAPQEHVKTEENLWMPLAALANQMHKLFYNILCQSAETRDALLKWLGDCLHSNAGRAKLWNSQLPELFGSLHVSDGFLINLEAVLLKLCKPFAQPFSQKLLKVDPSYCIAELSEQGNKTVHLKGLSSETCLIPREESMKPEDVTYNFTTECFFATHAALRLGFHVVHEKMLKVNQELVRVQRIYEDARQQNPDGTELVNRLKESMEKGMTRFLSYRTTLQVPETLDCLLNFHVATATWLIKYATNPDDMCDDTISFPLSETVSQKLSCIPEYILENIADCVIFMRRFNPKILEMFAYMLDHLMTLVLILMGSKDRVKNPHLRAHLAEMLEALMPFQEGEHPTVPMSSMYRERLFSSHPYVTELVPTLLNVFVSIEMTGQSVAFEQKFQYRRPMYIVLDYIWKFDLHKSKMKSLAEDAERNIESSHPPLFLHFINLLINDAIFLLDEALSYMSKLRELQIARDSGQWSSMSQDQLQQQEANFQHMGLLAKFHNVMSNETINTIQWLTTEIKSIFCHPSIVERITAMLNYFLLHLVGPQKKNLKVKDLKEYEFKPQELVRDICRIYYNLGSGHEQSECFCLAVSKDGRSYSPDLFPQAQGVLIKIGQSILATHLEEIAQTVKHLALKQQREEEMLTEAPDEFLDPIMNTIMKDPVRLPSSGVVVDRPTIARHLLSDQTDPFNRSPLTMDLVIPDVEMKERILQWMAERT